LLWQLPSGKSESYYFWYFLAGSFFFYLAYTVFATPWVALGYELTPDYHERTRLMGVQNFMGQLAYLVSPWFLWIMQRESLFDDVVDGAACLAIGIAVLTILIGIQPAIFLRERFRELAVEEAQDHRSALGAGALKKNVMDFLRGFAITLRFTPFLKLCAATFLVFNGFMLVASFQFYVIIYYVFSGDQELGAEYAGWAGTVSAISTFCVIFIVTWMSTRIGKRRAFFVSTGISIIGYGLKWFCYSPEYPLLLLLPAPFMAFGLGGLFTLMGSMIADVCDLDELRTHERREGMFGSIYWWVVKLGMAAALAAGGFLLNATGFDVNLGAGQSEQAILLMRIFDMGVPMLCSALAIWAIYTYPLTEERAYEVRELLERRRGAVEPT
jgi:GPH family glycoside/pentoside/hexuronide:cation symporter